MKLKEKLKQIKDAGFEIDDYETEDLLNSWFMEFLKEYNEFLMKYNYTDTDVVMEEPTAIDRFIKEFNANNKLNKSEHCVNTHSHSSGEGAKERWEEFLKNKLNNK